MGGAGFLRLPKAGWKRAEPAEHCQRTRRSAGHPDLSVRGQRRPGQRRKPDDCREMAPHLRRVPPAGECGQQCPGAGAELAWGLSPGPSWQHGLLVTAILGDCGLGSPSRGAQGRGAATPPWSPHCGRMFRPSVRPSALRGPRPVSQLSAKALPLWIQPAYPEACAWARPYPPHLPPFREMERTHQPPCSPPWRCLEAGREAPPLGLPEGGAEGSFLRKQRTKLLSVLPDSTQFCCAPCTFVKRNWEPGHLVPGPGGPLAWWLTAPVPLTRVPDTGWPESL